MKLDCLVPAPSFVENNILSSWQTYESFLPNGLKSKQWRKSSTFIKETHEEVESMTLPVFNKEEYAEKLNSEDWTFEETEQLIELVGFYGLRFGIIFDQIGRPFKTPGDLAERFAELCSASNALGRPCIEFKYDSSK